MKAFICKGQLATDTLIRINIKAIICKVQLATNTLIRIKLLPVKDD